jgi:hypothetical protein
MTSKPRPYPVKLEIDYPQEPLNRATTFFRILCAVPILVLITILGVTGEGYVSSDASQEMSSSGLGISGGLFAATALMILFRQRYPRWWFDFMLEFNRFSMRVWAYLMLLTDRYPSTVEQQSVHLDIPYPDVKQDLNRWLPLVKWLLALPHYVVLVFLVIGAVIATILAWFAILFTGRYPRGLFEFVVGVNRWAMRVTAYALLLTTDEYPPFSLQ